MSERDERDFPHCVNSLYFSSHAVDFVNSVFWRCQKNEKIERFSQDRAAPRRADYQLLAQFSSPARLCLMHTHRVKLMEGNCVICCTIFGSVCKYRLPVGIFGSWTHAHSVSHHVYRLAAHNHSGKIHISSRSFREISFNWCAACNSSAETPVHKRNTFSIFYDRFSLILVFLCSYECLMNVL